MINLNKRTSSRGFRTKANDKYKKQYSREHEISIYSLFEGLHRVMKWGTPDEGSCSFYKKKDYKIQSRERNGGVGGRAGVHKELKTSSRFQKITV